MMFLTLTWRKASRLQSVPSHVELWSLKEYVFETRTKLRQARVDEMKRILKDLVYQVGEIR